MKHKKILLIPFAALTLCSSFAQTVHAQNLDLLKKEFASPERENRPLTRWWVPGANMTKAEIRKEIISMSNAGFGGAEVVPVAMDGGDGNASIEWGTDAWKDLTNYMLQVAGQYNFTIDFTMTPAWPLALPTITDVNNPAQGAQMELDGAWIDGITKNNPFNGAVPTSEEAIKDADKVNGKVELIGVSVAKYIDKSNKVLDYDSAQTLKVKDGKVSFTPKDDGEYVIFAWYQHPSGNVKYGNNQIDHYSKASSQMIIDYWEKNLIPTYGDNFKNVRSLFIDSLEFETHLDWTYGVADGFKKSRGYDLVKYLPAVYDTDAYGNFMGDPEPDFKFNMNNGAIKNDFREYMTQLYIDNHIKPLKEFCNRHGVKLRYQTAYGKSLEVAQTAMYVDIPETESLYGSDYLDFYRLQSGAAHVAGRNIYSMETAAEWTEQWNPRDPKTGEFKTRGNGEKSCGNYQQTFQDHIWHDQRAFSAGVNQVVFHGYPYNGQFDGKGNVNGFIGSVKWPGFDGFSASTWSNSFGERQPNWIFANTYVDFLTRNQYILRKGVPKVDLAIYYQSYYETIDFVGSKKIFDDGGMLEQHGYTYDFISPVALTKLDNNDRNYKAIILNNQSTLTIESAKKLIEFANTGMPIVIVGKAPSEGAFIKDKSISANVATLLKMPSVIRVDKTEDIYKSLQSHGINADASYNGQTLLTQHRSDESIDYYYLYNYGNVGSYRDVPSIKSVDTTVNLKGKGNPYKLNAWTGEIEPLSDFARHDGSIDVKINLVGNDSTIIALTDENIATIPATAKKNFTTPINLNNWELTIESWTKGNNPSDMHKEIINVGTLNELKTWNQIDNLKNVSGIGTYKTSFNLDSGNQGAMLELSGAKDTFELKVNSSVVKLDPIDGKVDISNYIHKGLNNIEIIVASTLLNAVLKENTTDQRDVDNYGLFGTVVVRPYNTK